MKPFTYTIKDYKLYDMNRLAEEELERREASESIVTAKDFLIKLRKDHMNSIVETLKKLRWQKYLTKSIDKKVEIHELIKVLTEEYLEIESKLNLLESE